MISVGGEEAGHVTGVRGGWKNFNDFFLCWYLEVHLMPEGKDLCSLHAKYDDKWY